MKHLIIGLLLFFSTKLFAQSIHLPVGKKFTVNTTNFTIVDIMLLDQHSQMLNDGKLSLQFEVKSVSNNGFTIEMIPTHVVLDISAMGQQQKFDSDHLADTANNDLVKLLALLNKPQTIIVQNNKYLSQTNLQGLSSIGSNVDDANKYFLSIPDANIKQGYQWSDSIVRLNSQIINQYLILNVTDTQVEVSVTADVKIQITATNNQSNIKQSYIGYSTGKRFYNRTNGLLIQESLSLDMTGNTETKELNSPMLLKATFKTTVE